MPPVPPAKKSTKQFTTWHAHGSYVMCELVQVTPNHDDVHGSDDDPDDVHPVLVVQYAPLVAVKKSWSAVSSDAISAAEET